MQLSDTFHAEGAAFGDLNHDGIADVVAGPFWYAGPDFRERHEIYADAPDLPHVIIVEARKGEPRPERRQSFRELIEREFLIHLAD